ncbi:periplasmic binding protein type 2 domain containing protein [Colletotrichum incanum]|nr:periplasmic binding protein type 2 domain containing protein [Colletotrichum incanum]
MNHQNVRCDQTIIADTRCQYPRSLPVFGFARLLQSPAPKRPGPWLISIGTNVPSQWATAH